MLNRITQQQFRVRLCVANHRRSPVPTRQSHRVHRLLPCVGACWTAQTFASPCRLVMSANTAIGPIRHMCGGVQLFHAVRCAMGSIGVLWAGPLPADARARLAAQARCAGRPYVVAHELSPRLGTASALIGFLMQLGLALRLGAPGTRRQTSPVAHGAVGSITQNTKHAFVCVRAWVPLHSHCTHPPHQNVLQAELWCAVPRHFVMRNMSMVRPRPAMCQTSFSAVSPSD